MLRKTKKVFIFSSVVWDFYRTRPHEIAYGLSEKKYEIWFVEPIVYRNASSTRLKRYNINPKNSVHLIQRNSRLKKGFLLFIYENLYNGYLICRYRPQAVISGDIWMSFLVVLLCRALGLRFIFDNMDYWPAAQKSIALKYLAQHIIYPFFGKMSYAVMNTSRFLQKHMEQYSARSLYIPNAKSIQDISRSNDLIQVAQKQIVHNKVVFIGTLRDWYDYDLLISVFQRLPNIMLEVYGEGPMKKEIIERSKGCDNIAVYPAILSSEILNKIRYSDFGILPLRDIEIAKGVFPIKLLDYWMLKKPVIATPVGELREIAVNGGIILSSSVNDWVNRIQEMYADIDQFQRVGQRGHERVCNEFSYTNVISHVEQLI